MLRRIPKDLPLFGALVLGGGILAYGFTGIGVELAIGRPSSTSGLAVVFIPFWSMLAALVGFVIGLGLRGLWPASNTATEPPPKPTWMLVIILLGVIGAAGALGATTASQFEAQADPKILLDAGILNREIGAHSGRALRTGSRVYRFGEQPGSITWGTRSSTFAVYNDRVEVGDTKTSKLFTASTAALDYVTRIDAALLNAPSGSEFLALVISGRATGRRALVVVLNSTYEPVFEERVERFWQLDDNALEIRVREPDEAESVVIGPTCDESLVLFIAFEGPLRSAVDR